MSDDEVYNAFMDYKYDLERKKIREEYKKNPIIKTVGHLRYKIENLPDDMPISASCQCDSFTEWDLNLIHEESCLAFHLTMTPGAELI